MMVTNASDLARFGPQVLLAVVASYAIDISGFAQPTTESVDPLYGRGFSIRVVDENGSAVEGALAGLNVIRNPKEWTFGCNEKSQRTDAAGIVKLPKGARIIDRTAIVAIHESRGLAGINLPDERKKRASDGPYEVVLVPARRVVGTAEVNLPEHRGAAFGAFWGTAAVGKYDPIQWSSTTGNFELLLPPGRYEFFASGTYGNEVKRLLRVGADDATLQLDPIRLPPTALALMLGKPAPELRGVVGWKNSEGLKLSDLRGRYVLLHFWGHWCGPCMVRMPRLLDARERFPESKLAIVGVHVGIEGNDEIDTAQKLDTALAEVRAQTWGGRDLTFPVALVKAEKTADTDARSRAAADFGVQYYPTAILIDPEGRIVGDADHLLESNDSFAGLARLLDGDASQSKKGRTLDRPVIPPR